MLVLPMDVDQDLAQFLDLRKRCGPTVDVRARAASCFQDSAQHAHPGLVGEVAGLEPGLRPRRPLEGELGTDLGPAAAFPHQAGVAALTKHQPERVDENGLARAGLAGEHGEAFLELEVQAVHDHEVANAQGS